MIYLDKTARVRSLFKHKQFLQPKHLLYKRKQHEVMINCIRALSITYKVVNSLKVFRLFRDNEKWFSLTRNLLKVSRKSHKNQKIQFIELLTLDNTKKFGWLTNFSYYYLSDVLNFTKAGSTCFVIFHECRILKCYQMRNNMRFSKKIKHIAISHHIHITSYKIFTCNIWE